jgi:hypothetical protein
MYTGPTVERRPAWHVGHRLQRPGRGDRAFGWAGDHVEPGVSIANPDEKATSRSITCTCIGNVAEVMSGRAEARGASSPASTPACWSTSILRARRADGARPRADPRQGPGHQL